MPTSSTYLEVHLATPNEAVQEQLVALLEPLGYEAFVQEEGLLKAYIVESDYRQAQLNRACLQVGAEFLLALPMPHQNWNAAWEAGYAPVAVDSFCLVYAAHHEVMGDFEYKLWIEPQMSFGTGHHATTQLMIRQMKHLSFTRKRVLDLGAGTGVLGILALKMGAEWVDLVDIDGNCVMNMKENLHRNVVTNWQVFEGTITVVAAEDQYDVVLANINRNVLLAEAEEYEARLKPGGQLLLSGFFDFDAGIIMQKFTAIGLTQTASLGQDNWCTLLFSKP